MPSEEILNQPRPRRFQLVRRNDVNGMSGTGIVAEGIQFRDGFVVYRWLTKPCTTQMAESIHDVRHIHGHNGKTSVRWMDDAQPPGESKTINQVYEDRNLLALAFCHLAQQHPAADYAGGWHVEAVDDADADEWAISWATLPTGQVSWHVPRSLAENSQLLEVSKAYDGHTREDKNNRLVRFAHPQMG